MICKASGKMRLECSNKGEQQILRDAQDDKEAAQHDKEAAQDDKELAQDGKEGSAE
jgi:hypothetical protein